MDSRLAKDALSKAKLYAAKNDFINSLKFMLQGLREINSGGTPPTDIRACIRDALQSYSSEKAVKVAAQSDLAYTPGQEKALYVSIKKAYDSFVSAANSETYDEALARKKRLDKQIILGKKYIEEGKIAEADQALQVAITYYKDEKSLFPYIAKLFIDANQPARAVLYLKKALEEQPGNPEIKNMIQNILNKRNEG